MQMPEIDWTQVSPQCRDVAGPLLRYNSATGKFRMVSLRKMTIKMQATKVIAEGIDHIHVVFKASRGGTKQATIQNEFGRQFTDEELNRIYESVSGK